jgi:hypothetical protein
MPTFILAQPRQNAFSAMVQDNPDDAEKQAT